MHRNVSRVPKFQLWWVFGLCCNLLDDFAYNLQLLQQNVFSSRVPSAYPSSSSRVLIRQPQWLTLHKIMISVGTLCWLSESTPAKEWTSFALLVSWLTKGSARLNSLRAYSQVKLSDGLQHGVGWELLKELCSPALTLEGSHFWLMDSRTAACKFTRT